MAGSPASLELAAMQTVAEILFRLDDPAARARVLKWVNDYFSSVTGTSTDPAGTDTVTADASEQTPNLDPENLRSLFGDKDDRQPVDTVAPAPQPVISEILSFVADFQKLADEWRAA